MLVAGGSIGRAEEHGDGRKPMDAAGQRALAGIGFCFTTAMAIVDRFSILTGWAVGMVGRRWPWICHQ